MSVDPRVSSFAIHPAIGIVRLGNSPEGYFIGPEAPGRIPSDPDRFRDSEGNIKRQACRFRVFGLDEDGNAVQEITAHDAEIRWSVHPANKKAAWYEFEIPLDIPEARGELPANLRGFGLAKPKPTANPRRNSAIHGSDRLRLVIDPGPRTISGRGTNPDGTDPSYAFDTGSFMGIPVYLGELRTDPEGHLLVLGGFGRSGSAIEDLHLDRLVDNQLWYDDQSDGPVEAQIVIDGKVHEAEGAWVVVAPPNYAPGVASVVTMYDVILQVAAGMDPVLAQRLGRVSFARQIYPLFQRHNANQWVNAGFARDFGWGAASDFLDPATLKRLADPGPDHAPLRRQVFDRFRNPDYLMMDFPGLPPYYGDAGDVPPINDPRQWMAVLNCQYAWLAQWADGDFVNDLEDSPPSLDWDRISIADRPGALDRAGLDECLGGPFHPGSELTWIMRVPSLYSAPFRLRRRAGAEPDWGDVMTSKIALSPRGPLCASAPGDLTRWVAVPWQGDFGGCLSGYTKAVDPFLPGYWPSRVPNEVLTMENYERVVDDSLPLAERQAAFSWAARRKWMRPMIGDPGWVRINRFVREWAKVGIMIPARGAPPDFPETMWVETGRQFPADRPEDDRDEPDNEPRVVGLRRSAR